MTDRLAVITGASSGIGAALAAEAAREGYRLFLVARRGDRLRALADTLPTDCEVFEADLTEAGAIEALDMILKSRPQQPDVLVNNAGIGQSGAFADGSPERDLRIVDLNVRAAVDLTHRLLPHMLAQGSGGILNVASIVAYQPGPYASVYGASKAFIASFSDALHYELRGTGVRVCALCPGPVATEFVGEAGMEGILAHRLMRTLPAGKVAAAGWRGFMRGKRRVLPGLAGKLRAATAGLTPAAIDLPVAAALQRPPKKHSR